MVFYEVCARVESTRTEGQPGDAKCNRQNRLSVPEKNRSFVLIFAFFLHSRNTATMLSSSICVAIYGTDPVRVVGKKQSGSYSGLEVELFSSACISSTTSMLNVEEMAASSSAAMTMMRYRLNNVDMNTY